MTMRRRRALGTPQQVVEVVDHTRSERGTVTAEAALVLPIVAAFAMTLVWMVTIVIAQVQAVDAARDAARALARGEDHDSVLHVAHLTAPEGAHVDVVAERDGRVTVEVSVDAVSPRWLLVPLPSVSVDARSTVEVEADAGAGD